MIEKKVLQLLDAIQQVAARVDETQNPKIRLSLNAYADALTQGRLSELESCAEQVLAQHAFGSVDIMLHSVDVLLQLGLPKAAGRLGWVWGRQLRDRSQFPYRLVESLLTAGRWAQADVLYDIACQLDPSDADSFHNRGYALERLGRNLEAVGCYGRAVALRPGFFTAHCNLGNALFNLNRLDDAIACYQQAMRIRPDYVAAGNNLANAYAQRKEPHKSIPLLQALVAANPEYPDALNNLGFALQKLGRHAEALPYLQKAVAAKPDYAEAFNNLGHTLHKLSRYQDALAAFERAMALRADYAEAYWNRGLVKLLLADASGWSDMEWRWRRSSYQAYPSTRDSRPWRGEDLRGRSIVVTVEQGFGDMFQLSRYLLPLLQSAARVTFAAPRVIHRLLSTLSPDLKLVGALSETGDHDFHTTLFSLPRLLSFQFNAVYAPVPYLRAEPQLVARWRQRIGTHGFKVGISWQGNPAGDVDIGRSMPLRELTRLASVPGVRLISIQVQHGLEQLAELGNSAPIETLAHFNQGADGFLDTAAVMHCLDLVITTDSAPAHLAGALGVPVWTLVMKVPDWRWLLDRDDSPWYPTMKVFRQRMDGDWAEVVDRVSGALQQQVAASEGQYTL
jgi:tetratricopeptide (TPR) repeat protein